MNSTILVVDDDVEDHLILKEYFTEAGLEKNVNFKENGEEAIEYLKTLQPKGLPGLIVLDLNMPLMNGIQTLALLKEDFLLKDILVVICSTSNNEAEREKCIALGATDYIVKPFNWEEGMKMIDRFKSLLTNS
ncbi:MAG TPA: response regulator [Ohtaekwangia sp.]